MTIRPSILAPFLLTLTTAAACGPCADGRRSPVPGPGGPVIIAADMCDDGGDGTDGASSTGETDSDGPTDTSETTAGTDGASETGAECPVVACDQNGVCPGGTFCQAEQCVLTCPCQAEPGPCASKPFGGDVWFCPADAAPKCG